MEFVILRDTEVTFSGLGSSNIPGFIGRESTSPIVAKIQAKKDDADGTDNEHFSDQLTTAIIKNPWARRFSSEWTDIDWALIVGIFLPDHSHFAVDDAGTTDTGAGEKGQVCGAISVETESKSDNNFLSILRNGFNDHNLSMNVVIKNFGLTNNSLNYASGVNMKAEGVILDVIPNDTNIFILRCYDKPVVSLKPDILAAWKNEEEFCGTFTLSLVLSSAALSMLNSKKLYPWNEKFEHLKHMLEDEMYTDFEVLAGVSPDQKVVKCHRAFLAAGSDVFRRMFESGMTEATGNKIEIEEMSERGVRALLAYLYHTDLTEPYESSDIALELLQAGEKYNIQSLKESVRDYMTAKNSGWFGVDMVLELYGFVRTFCLKVGETIKDVDEADIEMESYQSDELPVNFEETEAWKSLKNKCLKVIRWYTKMKPKTLLESVKYQEIFTKNLKLGMEISSGMLRLD